MAGMLVAVPKACPVHGGKLKSFDAAAVLQRRGVQHVLRVDDATVAVVADTFWRAKTALDALPIVWDEGPGAKVSSDSIAVTLREGLSADTAYVGHKAGDAKAALAKAARVIEADYSYPYQTHAPMELLCATVRWTSERCEMWGPTQVADAALDEMAKAAGVPAAACEVHNMRIGGSFGRRLYTDYVRTATLNDGKLRIHRIVAATDPGHVVNPQQVEAQIAGSFVYGLSAMLYGECTLKDGRIEQQNFNSYNVMRLDEMPEVEVIAMPSGGFWGGVGEPTIAVAAPAVLNALFAATGKRVRDLPLKNTQL